MGYIKFDKAHVVNLEYSLSREILRSNRAGSYSSTTIVGCNTRKYHGWLVCPVEAMGGERHVLLSSVDSTVVSNGQSFNTGIHKYHGDHYSPKGHKYVEDFDIQDIPGMTYRVGNVIMKQERILVHYEEQLLIRYTIIDTDEPVKLQLRPFMTFRNIHQLTHANMWANTRTEPVPYGVKIRMYEGFPYLHMQLSCKAEFIPVPDWYLGVEYIEEQKRGYDYSEDLFIPGFFEMTASKGDVIVFSVSTKEEKHAGLKAKFTRTIATKIPRSDFGNCLRNAAQQFIECMLPMSLPFDHALEQPWLYDVKLRVVKPSPVQAGDGAESTIVGTKTQKFKWYRRLGTYGFRIKNELQRLVWSVWQ